MPAEERSEPMPLQKDAPKKRSFDELARGLAEGTITRGRALKLAGAAVLGFSSLGLLGGVAEARHRHHHRHGGGGGGGSVGGTCPVGVAVLCCGGSGPPIPSCGTPGTCLCPSGTTCMQTPLGVAACLPSTP